MGVGRVSKRNRRRTTRRPRELEAVRLQTLSGGLQLPGSLNNGAAAALAIDDDTAVQAVNYKRLRSRLIEDRQRLTWPLDSQQRPAN